jgi:RES domain-containing protein
MLNPPTLKQALAAAHPLAVPLTDLLFRSIHLQHFANFATAQPLYAGVGGPAGSRYIPPNGPNALYLAFDADTAHREGNQPYYQLALSPAGQALIAAGALRPDPVVLIGIRVLLNRLLDLRDPVVRIQLGIPLVTELLGPWKNVANAPTQNLGDAVFNDGFYEGIIYPSAQNPDHGCLVVFTARLLANSRIDFADTTTQLVAHLP